MSCGGGGGEGAALRAAAAAGDAATCARLLRGLRSVRFSRDELGRTALHLAASGGHVSTVRLLLNAAAPREVDGQDGTGYTALQRATAEGHEEVCRLLLARGADVDRQDTVHGNAAIHEAAWKGYSRTVSLLASAGADLSRPNAGGFTALHLCCQNGHNQSCRELLLAGCDPDLQNNYGDTALHTAARYGHAGVTRILISAKCRISEQNKNGDTALHIAAAMGRRKLTRILLEADCDKNIRNKQNESAREIALRKDLNEILEILDDHVLKKERKVKTKKRSKSKVRFDAEKNAVPVSDQPSDKGRKHWSPYGCHYFPDPEAFPAPRLDSLPPEPLKRGEQYYLDLAGNICKGPVGVGYTCYCAPLFRHLEARLEHDKRELQRAQAKLGQRVAGLEQRLIGRGGHERRSERVTANRERERVRQPPVSRSRSLEMLDANDNRQSVQATRSMEQLDPPSQVNPPPSPSPFPVGKEDHTPRCSVKELVARIQQRQRQSAGDDADRDREDGAVTAMAICHDIRTDCSESSDNDDDNENRAVAAFRYQHHQHHRQRQHNYHHLQQQQGRRSSRGHPLSPQTLQDTMSTDAPPRSRCGVYSPATVQTEVVPVNATHHYHYSSTSSNNNIINNNNNNNDEIRHTDLTAKIAKLRMLEGGLGGTVTVKEGTQGCVTRVVAKMYVDQHAQDVADNNDSGYSTKVYGSSKGNSPSFSGEQVEPECIRSSSLV